MHDSKIRDGDSVLTAVAYHQHAEGCTFGDDIRLAAMIYTLTRDDMPSLRLG